MVKNWVIPGKFIDFIVFTFFNRMQGGSCTYSECEDLGSEVNAKAVLEDVGHNADLYIAIQEDNTQN